MANLIIDNRKIKGGIVSTPGINTNLYYRRENDAFNINGAFNTQETLYDWATINSKESKFLKSGVIKLRADRKSLTIEFNSAFPSNEYYMFFTSSGNINLYTSEKRASRFTILSSFSVSEEISWLAIHRSLASKTGINNPGTLYAGSRIVEVTNGETLFQSPGVSYETLDVNNDAHVNLSGWYGNELIIKPTVELDQIPQEMDLSDYTVLLSSNVNINTFWNQKARDRVKICTSFPRSCIIDYLFIKEGINWWDEI